MAHLYQRDKSSAEGLQGIQKKAKKSEGMCRFQWIFFEEFGELGEHSLEHFRNSLESFLREYFS